MSLLLGLVLHGRAVVTDSCRHGMPAFKFGCWDSQRVEQALHPLCHLPVFFDTGTGTELGFLAEVAFELLF